MKNGLTQFLIALSESFAMQRAYQEGREALIAAFGLSDAEKAALRTGDEASIKALTNGGAVFNVVITKASIA